MGEEPSDEFKYLFLNDMTKTQNIQNTKLEIILLEKKNKGIDFNTSEY